MPNRNGVSTARFDKFWSQCHSKRAAAITHPPPPSNPSQIRTYSRSNPTFSSVLLFKLLQAANSLHLTRGNFLPSLLESWWGRGLPEDEFSELEELKAGGRGMNTGSGNAPRMGRPREARQRGASTEAPFPQPFPPLNSRSSRCPRPAPELASMQSSPLRSTHPLFGILFASVVSELPADPLCFPLAHTTLSVLSPSLAPPALAVSAAKRPPNPDSPLPLHTAPEQLLHPCNRSGKCLPHLPPNRSSPFPTLQPPRTRAGGAVGCTGG